MAFWGLRGNGINEIFVKNTTTGRTTQLTDSNDSMSDTSPAWSPDGSKIVFVSDNLADRSRDVWVMNVDGSGRKQLTTNSSNAGTVVWSPDGSKIAFDDLGSPSDIWVMNADGTSPRNITNSSAEAEWAPDWQAIP